MSSLSDAEEDNGLLTSLNGDSLTEIPGEIEPYLEEDRFLF